ncbi:MAG: aldehyde ferredoxin oxidoreductase family protein [Promethearchaeota archaeon]
MTELGGWMGRVARLDLSTGRESEVTPDEDTLEKFIGGTGVGVNYLTGELPAGVDPLGRENQFIIATGPLTGTKAPTSGRFSMVTKSPLTGTILDGNSGGRWGVMFKRCGFDALWVTGKASSPVYIKVSGAGLEVKDAEALWGRDVAETSLELKKIEGTSVHVLAIGPAGENLSLISAVMNDEHRAFGRGGVGAVWGSKNLKAIVVEPGTTKPGVARPESFQRYVSTALDKLIQGPITGQGLKRFGTAALVNVINEVGMFPVRNNQAGGDEHADAISGEAIRKRLFVKQEACFGCPIACGRVTKTATRTGKGPEYESVWALGAQCGVFDLEAVTEANYECNLLGLDTISTGATISCAMELAQRGIIEEKVEFGDAGALLPLVRKIARREGFGDELALGSRRFAEARGAGQYAMQVKGLELPAYDPRGAMGHALAYATSNRGGCHLRGYMVGWEVLGVPKILPRFNKHGKTDILVRAQNMSRVTDSLVTCKFQEYSVGADHLARLLSAATGLDFTVNQLDEVGERIWNLERLFNIREGLGRADDTLPRRFLEEPLEEGPSAGHVVDLETMLDEYYETRGWSRDGVPTKALLEKLGLEPLEA